MKLTAETTVFDENAVQNKFSELVVDQDGIRTEVGKKVGNTEVISRINQSAESIQIQADKVAIEADNFVTEYGSGGVKLHPRADDNNYVLMNSNGMDVYKGGDSVASYGDTVRLGKISEGESRIVIDANGMSLVQRRSGTTDVTLASFSSTTLIGAETAFKYGARIGDNGFELVRNTGNSLITYTSIGAFGIQTNALKGNIFSTLTFSINLSEIASHSTLDVSSSITNTMNRGIAIAGWTLNRAGFVVQNIDVSNPSVTDSSVGTKVTARIYNSTSGPVSGGVLTVSVLTLKVNSGIA